MSNYQLLGLIGASFAAMLLGIFLYAPLDRFSSHHAVWHNQPQQVVAPKGLVTLPGTTLEDVATWQGACMHDPNVLQFFQPHPPDENATVLLTPEEAACVQDAWQYLRH